MNALAAIIFVGVPSIIVAGLFWRILKEDRQTASYEERQKAFQEQVAEDNMKHFAPEVELSPLAITTMDYKDRHMIVGG